MPSPSAGPAGHFGERPDYPHVLDGFERGQRVGLPYTFSDDKTHIITISNTISTAAEDQNWQISAWNAATAEQIAALHGAGAAAALSPDAARLVTLAHGNADIWDVRPLTMRPEELVAEACTWRLPSWVFNPEEMSLIGYPPGMPKINVCDKLNYSLGLGVATY